MIFVFFLENFSFLTKQCLWGEEENAEGNEEEEEGEEKTVSVHIQHIVFQSGWHLMPSLHLMSTHQRYCDCSWNY